MISSNMSSKSASKIDPREPPFSFKSTKDLEHCQSKYSAYNLFQMISRLQRLKAEGIKDDMEIDKSSLAYKLYKDFEAPPAPASSAFGNLNLPPHWVIYMADKTYKKYPHKAPTPKASFEQVSRDLATAYKNTDPETKAWLGDVSSKLYAYNRAQRDELYRFIKKQREEKEEAEARAKKAREEAAATKAAEEAKAKAAATAIEEEAAVAGAGAPTAAASGTGDDQDRNSYISPSLLREQLAMRHLNSLQIQALALSARPTYEYVPFMIPFTYASNALSGLAPIARQPSSFPMRQLGDDPTESLSRESKRARLEFRQDAAANLAAREAYLNRMCIHNTLPSSTFAPTLPFATRAFAGIPNIGMGGSLLVPRALDDNALRRDHVMLGYEMGLRDAARARTNQSNALPSMSRQAPNGEGNDEKKG